MERRTAAPTHGQFAHTAAEVARRLNLHRQTVYRLARNGDLPMTKIGRHWFMADVDLARLLSEGQGGES